MCIAELKQHGGLLQNLYHYILDNSTVRSRARHYLLAFTNFIALWVGFSSCTSISHNTSAGKDSNLHDCDRYFAGGHVCVRQRVTIGETADLEKIIQKLTGVVLQKDAQELPPPKIDISRVGPSQQETRSVANNSTVPSGEQEPVTVVDISTVAASDPRFRAHVQDLLIGNDCVVAFEDAGVFANNEFGFDINAIADDPHPLSFEYSVPN